MSEAAQFQRLRPVGERLRQGSSRHRFHDNDNGAYQGAEARIPRGIVVGSPLA